MDPGSVDPGPDPTHEQEPRSELPKLIFIFFQTMIELLKL